MTLRERMKLKDKIIRKLGGYTKEDYEGLIAMKLIQKVEVPRTKDWVHTSVNLWSKVEKKRIIFDSISVFSRHLSPKELNSLTELEDPTLNNCVAYWNFEEE